MTKFIVVSDIHGSAPALDAVIDAEGTDTEYAILGDIHGLLAYPKEVTQAVQHINGRKLVGNHDYALFHKEEGHVVSAELSEFELQHTLDNLSPSEKHWMKERPFLDVIERGGQRICLCHAYPWPSHASGYEPGNAGVKKRDVAQVAATVSDDYDWVFHGHTHEQYDLDCSKFGHDVHFVNPGSLGYDHTYSVVDVASGEVAHKSVEVKEDVQAHVQQHLPEDAPHTREWL